MAERIIVLTDEEASFVLNVLHVDGHGHGSSKHDFEPECPSCTAAAKLEALVAIDAEATHKPVGDSASSTNELVRQCGGIVHSDGNIFFANRYQFEHAASLLCGTATIAVAKGGRDA
jgi:hypothetical protein